MEIASSAITSALRVGVNVLVGRKRPVLEIYFNLNNIFGPPVKIDLKSADGYSTVRTDEHRFQDIFIDLIMINIGGIRAENITFETAGDFKRERLREELPELFKAVTHQSSPGQSHYLMRIDQFDLHTRVPDTDNPSVSRSGSIKSDTLTITVHYDGPSSLGNWIFRLPRRIFGKKQYSTRFVFNPLSLMGDLPPPKYS